MFRFPALFAPLVCLASIVPFSHAQTEDGIGGKKWSQWLETLKSDKDVRERRKAVIALQVAGPKVQGVVDGLFEALAKDPEPELRRDIALLFGQIDAEVKGAPEALGEALRKDKADTVREAAARSLGSDRLIAKADTQVLALAEALKDAHQGTRVAAAIALKGLGDKVKPALETIGAAAKNDKNDRYTRLYALQIIGKWGDVLSSPPILIGVAKESNPPPGLREAALEGLGRIAPGHMQTCPLLAAALADKNVDIRRAAASALGIIGDKAATAWPAIKTGLEDGDAQVRHQLFRAAANVAKDQKEAVSLIFQAAKNDLATENRLAAILELGELGAVAKDILPDLIKFAEDEPRPALREAAQKSIEKIKGAAN